ncbi:COMM domain-containing protein 8-like [Periplaneta americana]|uniref:COMM domain-containing protein 8-like n=1 Tax=Periplaneta americana TaxID=6978 RepID=UPI0037E7E758
MEDQGLKFQNILQNAPINAFQECLHMCINDICGKKTASYESFKSVTNWTNEEYDMATSGIKHLFLEAVVNHLNEEEILEKISQLDTNRQEMILECLAVRRVDIQNVMLQKTCAISGPILQDFDWKVKWVMGSSKLSSLREPLLSLDLHLTEGRSMKNKNASVTNTLNLELDKNELNKLISVLEKAQEAMSNWQS